MIIHKVWEEDSNYKRQTYYVSLVRGLLGYYVKFNASDEEALRAYLNEYFSRLWCSIYLPEDMPRLRDKYSVTVINEDKPIVIEE